MTHVALRTMDLEASLDFYRRYAGFEVVHEREDGGTRVAWMSNRRDDPDFVLVLLRMAHEPSSETPSIDHLGFAVSSREEVDRIGALARSERRLRLPPTEGGPIVGYFVMVRDPSGNTCEFSFGQPIRPRDLPRGRLRSRARGE
jgi:catechol 2,3-dioxygenase-like lactoylglutathione lyase family enzyme